MNKITTNKIDIASSLKHFFTLQDWVKRSAQLGAVYFVLGTFFVITMFFVGFSFAAMTDLDSQFKAAPIIFIIITLFSILSGLISIIFQIYLTGYKLEFSSAIADNIAVENIPVFANFRERIVNGFKLSLANFIYMLPSQAVFAFGYFFILIEALGPGFTKDPTQTDITAIKWLVFIVCIAFAGIYFLIVNFLVIPAINIEYLKNKSFINLFKLGQLFTLIKQHLTTILMIQVTIIIAGVVWYMVYMFAGLLTIVLIGYLLMPIVYLFYVIYFPHLSAYLYGEALKNA